MQSSKPQTILTLFEQQVEETPDSQAILFDGVGVSYRELHAKSNDLAQILRQKGLKTGDMVGVFLDRSIEAIVCILGIFKAGGTYVPLDPTYPKERLSFILEDCQLSIILTQKSFQSTLPSQNYQIIDVDGSSNIGDEGEVNQSQNSLLTILKDDVSPEHIAYVIYTSGSTGQPKGVLISHRALAIHSGEAKDYYQLTAKDRVLLFASLNFDPSLEQILPPLISGAGVVIMGNPRWNANEFYERAIKDHLTIINLPPAYWQLLFDSWQQISLEINDTELRLIIIGGDVLPVSLQDAWQERSKKSMTAQKQTVGYKSHKCDWTKLLNAYGPTEATITSCCYEIGSKQRDPGVPMSSVPIGRPFGSRSIYILDQERKPVINDEIGEIYIGGDHLADGYLNRPELTEEKFIPDPFSAKPGARLYLTGDLGRCLPDGNIEFLGRVDHQVKIRGYRIELGEIETALLKHPAIIRTMVLAREGRGNEKQLVGYLVCQGDSIPSVFDLHSYLKQRVPDYMVPNDFVFIEEFPLMPNGKIDRNNLPPPGERSSGVPYKAPRNDIERQLSSLWMELFGVDKVGIEDNFFVLGGHSMQATQLLQQIADRFYIQLSLVAFYQSPTIADLAVMIEENQNNLDDLSELELEKLLSEVESLSPNEIQAELPE